MKISKQARHIARSLYRDSLTYGRLDESKVRTIASGLVAAKPRELIPILKTYERLVRLEIERNTARVESAVAHIRCGERYVDRLEPGTSRIVFSLTTYSLNAAGQFISARRFGLGRLFLLVDEVFNHRQRLF